MANVALQASDLMNAAKKMEDAAGRIDKALQNLDSVMGGIDSVWKDRNSKTYLERYDELKQEFPTFKNAVHSYGQFLEDVVDTYRKEFIEDVSTSVN